MFDKTLIQTCSIVHDAEPAVTPRPFVAIIKVEATL